MVGGGGKLVALQMLKGFEKSKWSEELKELEEKEWSEGLQVSVEREW